MIKQDNKRITLTLGSDLVEQLELYCQRRCISKTNYIRELIEKNLKLDIANADATLRGFARYKESTSSQMDYKCFKVYEGGILEYLACFNCQDKAREFCENDVDNGDIGKCVLYGYECYGVKHYLVETKRSLEEFSMEFRKENNIKDCYIYDSKTDKKILIDDFFDNHKI